MGKAKAQISKLRVSRPLAYLLLVDAMRCEVAYRLFVVLSNPGQPGLIWFGWMRLSCGLCVCGLEEGLGSNIKRGGVN